MHIATFEQRFQQGLEAMEGMPLAAARRHYDALCDGFAPSLPDGMEIRDARIDSVAVRHYRPLRCRPGVVAYVHGGGFSLGSLDSHQGIAAGLAQALEREVVSVGYRLLPESSYAEALDDCRRVFAALTPSALVGDSAGGRLILDAVVEPAGTEARQAPLLGLIYPLVGTPTLETLGPDAPLLSRQDVLSAWDLIAPDVPKGDGRPAPAAALEVLAVTRDPLTAPLRRAVEAWRGEAGAEVGFHLADDMLHGCLHARESLPAMAMAWRRFCTELAQRLRDLSLHPTDKAEAGGSVTSRPNTVGL